MIVTGKRCFLNVLTQLWPAERLLKANYYVGDKISQTANAYVNDQVTFDEFGRPKIISSGLSGGNAEPFATPYNIKCNNVLDPTPFSADFIMGESDDGFNSAEERFIHHLNNPETMVAVYNFLFKDQLQDSNIQILIFESDTMLWRFGHIICQYLSINFGVDIIFIDPQYKSECRGFANYTGDKEHGKQMVTQIRNNDMLLDFDSALTSSEYFGSISNLVTHINARYNTWEDIMLLYNLLFPSDPLPPGNYSISHIKEIIIDRCSRSMNKIRSNNTFNSSNLLYWDDVVARANDEYIDYNEDDDYGGSDTGLY